MATYWLMQSEQKEWEQLEGEKNSLEGLLSIHLEQNFPEDSAYSSTLFLDDDATAKDCTCGTVWDEEDEKVKEGFGG